MRRLLLAVLAVAACGEDPPIAQPDLEVCLPRSDGRTYCIDVYEAARADATEGGGGTDEASGPISRPTRLPWAMVSWDGAKAACDKKAKRLCERDEWLDACDGQPGAGGTKFTYGSTLTAGRCNTDGGGVLAGGVKPDCKSKGGTFDQSGNVREWTGNNRAQAAARGGSWKSDLTHDCLSGDTMQILEPSQTSPEVGFRCCRDR